MALGFCLSALVVYEDNDKPINYVDHGDVLDLMVGY